jgi:NAD(P)-dependent dehydrogenase (short-subunit alcohol dehydrogenase family)
LREKDLTMQSKVVVVTGATDGIGRETTRELALRGAHLTLIGRNAAKGDTVVRILRGQTGNEQIHFIQADLSSRRGVLHAAGLLRERFNAIDVLVNNAGALFQTRQLSADGIEMTLALNHLAYFLMTSELLDLLVAADQGRVVNVASAAHLRAALDLDDLQMEKAYSGWSAYARSKLANIYFTYELARRLQGTRVTANCLHPGFVASAFGDNNTGFLRLLLGLAKSVAAISERDGARTSVYCATDPSLNLVTGQYFDKCKPATSSSVSHDGEIAKRLWDRSEVLCGSPFKKTGTALA